MATTTASRFRRPIVVALLVIAVVTGCGEGYPPAPPSTEITVPAVPLRDVLATVRKAAALRTVPSGLTPALGAVPGDFGFDHDHCEAAPAADRIAEPCVFGDPAGSTKIVLWGDSQAGMWLPALGPIADRQHWRLTFYGKPACPTPDITVRNQQEDRGFSECDRFRTWVEGRIVADRPGLVLLANQSFAQETAGGAQITPPQWRDGMTRTMTALGRSGARVALIGEMPVLTDSAPDCLRAHPKNVAACITTRAAATARVWNAADEDAARATDAGYIDVLPWLCSSVCPPVIGDVVVYRNRFHLTASYARRMNGVLEHEVMRVFAGGSAP